MLFYFYFYFNGYNVNSMETLLKMKMTVVEESIKCVWVKQ